jgi:hypothetical protein
VHTQKRKQGYEAEEKRVALVAQESALKEVKRAKESVMASTFSITDDTWVRCLAKHWVLILLDVIHLARTRSNAECPEEG